MRIAQSLTLLPLGSAINRVPRIRVVVKALGVSRNQVFRRYE